MENPGLDPVSLDDEEREIVGSFEQSLDDGTLVSHLTPERQMELRAAAIATSNQSRKIGVSR